jgi:hypothetical protein
VILAHRLPIHALPPRENGAKAFFGQSPRNLSGIKLSGSGQYFAVGGFSNISYVREKNARLRCRAGVTTITKESLGTGTTTGSPLLFSVFRVVFSVLFFGITVTC